MPEIPHGILSEHYQEFMKGRRLIALVFLTFRFDSAFFEQEVLPVFLDIPLSHAPAIKLLQLEDALRSVPDGVAVYYDQNGLVVDAGSAKLDVKRVPVRHRTGIFHPKNVFVLVEDSEVNETGQRPRVLLVSSLSGNLTRGGWWENVEVCHTEEIREGEFTRLRDDVVGFLEGLERRVGERAAGGHGSVRSIRDFLRRTEQRAQRSTDGVLHTHFYDGRSSVTAFLRETAGTSIEGINIEIISPYFDSGPVSVPLQELIDQFRPREVRVLLPRKDNGEALCSDGLYEWVRSQAAVSWARLPKNLLRRGRGDEIRQRSVHAKVYRFFSAQPKREILFVGSANLTVPAHHTGGNLETGFVVEVAPQRRPEWWLEADMSRPRGFESREEDEGTAASGGTRLALRFHWNTTEAEVFWDDSSESPLLGVECQGVRLFSIEPLSARIWTALSADSCMTLERVLRSTSILTIIGDGLEPSLLLVQEEGMSHRPSLLFDLSPAEVLRYWSLLTAEQRAVFIEARAPDALFSGEGAALTAAYAHLAGDDTFFDRFAGIFHAFGCFERNVSEALREGREREATYRLFGEKYDSLGTLLNRIVQDNSESKGDPIEHYIISLCTSQLVSELRRNHREYLDVHAADMQRLLERCEAAAQSREVVVARDPDRMPAFLEWFEHWFLRRAVPIDQEKSS